MKFSVIFVTMTLVMGFHAQAAEVTSDDKEIQRICQQQEAANNVGRLDANGQNERRAPTMAPPAALHTADASQSQR